MGATAAIGAGLSVVGGLASLNQKQKQAKAQRKLLDQQKRQQQLQADLQLFALKQQQAISDLNDALAEAAARQNFLATDSQLKLQQLVNQNAADNAILAASVENLKDKLVVSKQRLSAEELKQKQQQQAEQELIAAIKESTDTNNALLKQLIDASASKDEQRNSLISLLDAAAAQGGINEALSLLLDTDKYDVLRNEFASKRAQEQQNLTLSDKENKAQLTKQLATLLADMGLLEANAQELDSNARLQNLQREAELSKRLSNIISEGKRLANQTNFDVSLLASDIQKKSRYLQQKVNEQALALGNTLSKETLEAQKQLISRPGFFDYANVALGAYNTYNLLSPNKPLTLSL
jgi:hypothetical protein